MDSPLDEYLDVEIRTLNDVPDTDVYEIRLSRPGKHNALLDRTVESLAETFESVGPDDGDAIVLSAAGDDFCLGADVGDLDPAVIDNMAAPAKRMQRLVASIRSCPLPVVARVHGRALGAGFLLCLGADLVVTADDATFALPEANLGIPVAGFATALLPRLIGERRAREWLFTGTHVSGTRAADVGFATRAVPANRLDETLDELLITLAGTSSAALAALKSRMTSPVSPDEETLRESEREAMYEAFTEGDASARLRDLLS